MSGETKFQLRGVCDKVNVDAFFVLKEERELLGYIQSKIVWSEHTDGTSLKETV